MALPSLPAARPLVARAMPIVRMASMIPVTASEILGLCTIRNLDPRPWVACFYWLQTLPIMGTAA